MQALENVIFPVKFELSPLKKGGILFTETREVMGFTDPARCETRGAVRAWVGCISF
jgi:hypothetical protein